MKEWLIRMHYWCYLNPMMCLSYWSHSLRFRIQLVHKCVSLTPSTLYPGNWLFITQTMCFIGSRIRGMTVGHLKVSGLKSLYFQKMERYRSTMLPCKEWKSSCAFPYYKKSFLLQQEKIFSFWENTSLLQYNITITRSQLSLSQEEQLFTTRKACCVTRVLPEKRLSQIKTVSGHNCSKKYY